MTKSKPWTVAQLAEIFKVGNEAAKAADPGPDDDGGSCCFDCPAFMIPRARKDKIEAAAELAGVRVTHYTRRGGGSEWWLSCTNGQALRRTRMAEAATKAMRELVSTIPGMEVRTYYALD